MTRTSVYAMRPRIVTLTLALAALLAAAPARAQLPTKPTLNLAAVKRIAAAAEAEATRNGWNVVIVIVDDAGNLLWLQRMDRVQLGSLEVAQRKARAAAIYRRPTKAFADMAAQGNPVVSQLAGAIALEGGVPIVVDGQTVGAVGVSGVTGQQDGQIAQAGVNALAPRPGGGS